MIDHEGLHKDKETQEGLTKAHEALRWGVKWK